MKKLLCLTLAALLAIGLGGCGDAESKDIRLDMSEKIYNLDPQFSTGAYARIIIANSFEGLVRQEAAGTIVPGAAEDITVSADGREYTFTLREDARWSRRQGRDSDADGGPVTAYDFQFAFRRMFDPQVPSPYSGEYLMIQGAAEALAGEAPAEDIGVRALDDRTLRITLTEAAPFFLQRLAAPPAMPCNEAFFEETRARYGLEAQYLQFNGPYRVSTWDNEKYIALSGNGHYWDRDRLTCPGVVFYTSRLEGEDGISVTPRQLFLEGKADIARVEYGDLEELERDGVEYMAFDDSLWVLVFNQRKEAMANEKIRQALASVLERDELTQRVSQRYARTDSLVPASARVFDKTYLELAGEPRLLSAGGQDARELLAQGLQEAGYGSLPTLTLLLPKSADMGSLAGYFQKLWQQGLNQLVNLNMAADGDFQDALRSFSGDWDMAILPVQVDGEDPSGTLTAFASGSAGNHTGYADPDYDRLLEQAQAASRIDEAVDLYRQAEQRLLDGAVAVPLYTQSAYYALGPGVTGVEVRSGGSFDFRSAFRK